MKAFIKADLKYYPDRNALISLKDWFVRNDSYYIRKYIVTLRHVEYHKNNNNNLYHKILYVFWFVKWKRISYKMALEIPANTCDAGLWLFHSIKGKIGIVPHAKIGKRVIIRPGVVLGYAGDSMRENKDAPIIEDDVEFSWGAKVFGKIRVGRGALLNANSVPMGNVPPYAIMVGNPAKVIGFTKTPKEIVEYEKLYYPENERLSIGDLEKNYQKYFMNRFDDVKKHVSVK